MKTRYLAPAAALSAVLAAVCWAAAYRVYSGIPASLHAGATLPDNCYSLVVGANGKAVNGRTEPFGARDRATPR